MFSIKVQIADFLNIPSNAILRCEEWEYIYFVVIAGRGGRFVSKRVVVKKLASLTPVSWTLRAAVRRQEGKKWVARICGLHPTYTFQRQFVSPVDIEWGRSGMKVARFEIGAPGYYQDSDRDYFKVWQEGQELVAEMCSYQEVKHVFTQRQQIAVS